MVTPLEKGSLIWVNFDLQAGHEQAGHRPALVISEAAYLAATGLALVVPVTSHKKNYPFEVTLPAGCAISGVILSDQVKCLDLKARMFKLAGKAPQDVVDDVLAKLAALVGWT
ncbi:type II toxin-antitoxin system PemK/MazF family toxin [Desulfovibrio psychrotolerans]|uniref:mRNA-degrading endonuclease n=1 Tax=Desulfovibrio psychrotolerans TaxID=415242 RepID=A0A7J0BUT3_9BACT|nr:type II toxin-antitoxin system PemK/MazF family toxin [Desulfovibrio psychrotolerans]GFM36931.1 mRNA-degrading endonuclease [Desulfovibrio psychrotolerans]